MRLLAGNSMASNIELLVFVKEQIISALQGRATPDELRAIRQWRVESPENEVEYQQLSALWSLFDPLSEMAEPPSLRAPELTPAIKLYRPPSVAGRTNRSRKWLVAAALATVVATGFFIGRLQNDPSPLVAGELRTGIGEVSGALLTDGSTVRLAPLSRLVPVADPTGRAVRLEGKAFFEVSREPGSTFTVYTEAGKVEVLGTRFEVRAVGDDFRVVVAEGLVRVSGPDRDVKVATGQWSSSKAGGPTRVEVVEDLDTMLSWMNRRLVFQNDALSEVLEALEGVYEIEVRLENPEIRNRTITASFGEESLVDVLSVICQAADVLCTIDGPVVTVR